MSKAASKRVLIVDDAGLVRLYCRHILEHAGYQVQEALNGVEAIEKLLRQSVDLIIVDVNMPQMDGLSFLKLLRRQEGVLAAIPVLVSSTESQPRDMAAARAAGGNFYLVKPLKQEILLEYAALLSGDCP